MARLFPDMSAAARLRDGFGVTRRDDERPFDGIIIDRIRFAERATLDYSPPLTNVNRILRESRTA